MIPLHLDYSVKEVPSNGSDAWLRRVHFAIKKLYTSISVITITSSAFSRQGESGRLTPAHRTAKGRASVEG